MGITVLKVLCVHCSKGVNVVMGKSASVEYGMREGKEEPDGIGLESEITDFLCLLKV